MNKWREERVESTTHSCWHCRYIIHDEEFYTNTDSAHHGCWKLDGEFEPGFDLMSGVYPKCPLPKIRAMHYMSDNGSFCRFKVEPVPDAVESFIRYGTPMGGSKSE